MQRNQTHSQEIAKGQDQNLLKTLLNVLNEPILMPEKPTETTEQVQKNEKGTQVGEVQLVLVALPILLWVLLRWAGLGIAAFQLKKKGYTSASIPSMMGTSSAAQPTATATTSGVGPAQPFHASNLFA
jgi:hypothetical protein